ncbi:hypothetical protein DM01DRAFT_1341209 [Hesseltinella vesiculosa]|uniref:Ras-GEF domain-containing protein n=1 Tax=Hesseltinella vesiculosa TaxID=101127 RepID=A0A1X2GX00_9FUNG|nr:hypothetical protein DM01DRAFT_1341209 [Hesseltinella vesiculosa]
MAVDATLPQIPLSPFAKAWHQCRTRLERATGSLTQAKEQLQPPVDVAVLRKLIEEVRVEQHRHDNFERQIHSVQDKGPWHWSPDAFAKQIAIVNGQLFGRVVLDKQLLCQWDFANTHLDRFLDFHRYLTHNMAHQLIYWSPASAPNPVAHLIQVAQHLLHAYRDMSGFVAVMKALMLPQVRRLRPVWKACPAKHKDVFKEMMLLLNPDQQYQAYHQVLGQHLARFFFSAATFSSSQSMSRMVVIPWMQPHLLSLYAIVQDYAVASTPARPELVLSGPGLRKLAVTMALLEQCQTCRASAPLQSPSPTTPASPSSSSSSSMEILEDYLRPWLPQQQRLRYSSDATTVSKRLHRQSMLAVATSKPSLTDNHPLVSDLLTLPPGDVLLHHWLVSRVYLQMDQLLEESLHVHPLATKEAEITKPLAILAVDDQTIQSILQDKHPFFFSSLILHDVLAASLPTDQPVSLSASDPAHDGLSTTKNDDNDDDDDDDDGLDVTTALFMPAANATVDADPVAKATTNHSRVIDADQPTSSLLSDRENAPLPHGSAHANNNDPEPASRTSKEWLEPDQPSSDNKADPSQTHHQAEQVAQKDKSSPVPLERNGSPVSAPAPAMSNETVVDAPVEKDPVTTQSRAQATPPPTYAPELPMSPSVDPSSPVPDKLATSTAKLSALSPTAPEFIPSTMQRGDSSSSSLVKPPSSKPDLTRRLPSSMTVSPASSYADHPANDTQSSTDSEEWNGYPTPALDLQTHPASQQEDDEADGDIWTGYPGTDNHRPSSFVAYTTINKEDISFDAAAPAPNLATGARRGSLQSLVSDEWKGYHAAKMEASWELETALKVQQHDWQGYALGALDDEEPEDQ